jgi:Nucleotidyltransferase domain
MPPDKQDMLITVTDDVRNVRNVAALVLGGSYESGLARSDSDIDIGIYYHESSPFSINEVRSVAERVCAAGSVPIVTGLYEWGPWVNGGAWIQTRAGKVDFLYRSLEQIRTVIEEGGRGIWRHDYDQQPPYGFRSVVYFGETHICIPLHDPHGEIVRLKQLVAGYPPGWRHSSPSERRNPNSGLGKAITYLLRHWKGLTLFLREAGRLWIIIWSKEH